MKRLLLGAGLALLVVMGIGVGLYAWLLADLPGPAEIDQRLAMPSVRITDRRGRTLYEVMDPDQGRHTILTLEGIPLSLQQATIATEDQGFYHNPGVDLRGVARALWTNLRGGDVLAGGSTITQQVVRNLLLDEEERAKRTFQRKVREIWLAWRLSRHLEKDEILALYLNQIYYGAMTYGVEAAAQSYFGKPAADLTLAESALLAGLPQAPAVYNPLVNPEAAKARQLDVLALMERGGFITTAEQTLAAREPLRYASSPYPILAPHFVMMVRAEIDAHYSQEEIRRHGGLVVRTSLDLEWQRHAERTVAGQLQALNQPPEGGPGHEADHAALVALDPRSGEILALVGNSGDLDEDGGAINMALAPRQPGSAIKPIIYAAALSPERPEPWTAGSVLYDVRTVFVTHEGMPYVPVNFSRQEHGPVLLREALASSLNIPAVAVLDSIGVETATSLAAGMGITTLGDPDTYDLSFALGGGAVSLQDLTVAYGVLANGGSTVQPQIILEVTDAYGQVLYQAPPAQSMRVLDEGVAWLISDILADDEARRLSFGANSVLKLDRPAAVKTGTTNELRDNWVVGYTPQLVVGVWVGNADNRPMEDVSGISGAGPIWHRFMRMALSGQPKAPFRRPDGLVQVEICSLSGLLPGENCPYARQEWFLNGTQPLETDTFFKPVTVDAKSGTLLREGDPDRQLKQVLALDLPPILHPWARSQGLTLLVDLGWGEGAAAEQTVGSSPMPDGEGRLRLVSPDASAVYRISPSIPISAQKLHFEAVSGPGLEEVTLWLDGEILWSSSRPPYQAWWTLEPGRHVAWAEGRDEGGEVVKGESITFEVRGLALELAHR